MVTVDRRILARYRRFTLYNSPYPAHATGAAIDLYPPRDAGTVSSPVAGTVQEVLTVDAPTRPYADPHDHLVVVDTGPRQARLLHVDPTVTVGEDLAFGDRVGALVTSGYAAPWVPDHLHLGFRDHGTDPRRARGSLPVTVDVPMRGVPWDGTGTVVATGDTYAILDAPVAREAGFAGVAADGGGVLDGGFPHYAGGGLFGGEDGPVTFLGTRIGTARDRTVTWSVDTVRVDDSPIKGLSFSMGQDGRGVKLVCPDRSFSVGDRVRVRVG